MAQNTTVTVPSATWTQITDANVTSITFQNLGGNYCLIKSTSNTTAPTTTTGAIRYNPGQGERNVALSDLFPGVTSAARVWAYATDATAVMVSHA